jgi:thiamine biosynthesis lipoprotein
MSDYRQTSELNAVCRRAGGGPVRVSEDLFRVLARAQHLAERTGGAFDVTCGPAVRLWRRARRTGEMPEPGRIAEALELVGHTKLRLDPATRSVALDRPGMQLDLGGIAKGYAADEALAVLRGRGVRRALVAASGDIAVGDPPPGERGWRISIEPFGAASGRAAGAAPPQLLLSNAAVSTSGDAEQFVEIGGIRYSHVVDPRTGVGVTGHGAATVVAADATTSDSLATAASVLGPAEGVRLADATPGAAALIVRHEGARASVSKSARWDDVPKVAPSPGQ